MFTLMAVHAHPDDEATMTGGILARYADEGVRTVLVTCTDGRCGDGTAGVKPGEPGHDPEAVVTMRARELDASCAVLGITHLETLGYADSGMMGWPQNDAENSFWSTPVDHAADKLVALVEKYRPDVIVTYDPNGFYGHPDHIQAHRITMAAARQSAPEAKLYWTAMPTSAVRPFFEMARAAEFPELPDEELEAMVTGFEEFATDDADISAWIDVRNYAGAKFDALSAHASQSDHAVFLGLGREGFAQAMGIETFVRVGVDGSPSENGPAVETDLFAGLR